MKIGKLLERTDLRRGTLFQERTEEGGEWSEVMIAKTDRCVHFGVTAPDEPPQIEGTNFAPAQVDVAALVIADGVMADHNMLRVVGFIRTPESPLVKAPQLRSWEHENGIRDYVPYDQTPKASGPTPKPFETVG